MHPLVTIQNQVKLVHLHLYLSSGDQVFQPKFLHTFLISTACYSFADTVRVIKSRRMRWVRHGGTHGVGRSVYKVLVYRPEGSRLLGKSRHRLEDNVKMDLREIRINGVNWMLLAQDRVRWRAFFNTMMNLQVQKQKVGYFLTIDFSNEFPVPEYVSEFKEIRYA